MCLSDESVPQRRKDNGGPYLEREHLTFWVRRRSVFGYEAVDRRRSEILRRSGRRQRIAEQPPLGLFNDVSELGELEKRWFEEGHPRGEWVIAARDVRCGRRSSRQRSRCVELVRKATSVFLLLRRFARSSVAAEADDDGTLMPNVFKLPRTWQLPPRAHGHVAAAQRRQIRFCLERTRCAVPIDSGTPTAGRASDSAKQRSVLRLQATNFLCTVASRPPSLRGEFAQQEAHPRATATRPR